jgi:hypothetical protein
MTDPDEVIRAAEEVAVILESQGVGALVIGAVALAAHGYLRFTDDIDLGVNTDLVTLHNVAEALRTAGFDVELREPDGQDPSGVSGNRLRTPRPLSPRLTSGSSSGNRCGSAVYRAMV